MATEGETLPTNGIRFEVATSRMHHARCGSSQRCRVTHHSRIRPHESPRRASGCCGPRTRSVFWRVFFSSACAVFLYSVGCAALHPRLYQSAALQLKARLNIAPQAKIMCRSMRRCACNTDTHALHHPKYLSNTFDHARRLIPIAGVAA